MLAQVALQHFGHQARDRTTDSGDLLQHAMAVNVLAAFDQTFQRVRLPLDSAHACKQAFLTNDSMSHCKDCSEVLERGTQLTAGRSSWSGSDRPPGRQG